MVSMHAIAARYNIAPTQQVSCVTAGESGSARRDWQLFRWGLIPSWATDSAIGNRMINARSETVQEKRSFKKAFLSRRCLVPADGYFEWMKTPNGKQPFSIERADGGLLAMAGLWEQNTRIDNESPLQSFTILTTAANSATKKIHDRMPVLLDQADWDHWLDPDFADLDTLQRLMKPAAEDYLKCVPVSTLVNSPRNDTPECVQPITIDGQPSLFN